MNITATKVHRMLKADSNTHYDIDTIRATIAYIDKVLRYEKNISITKRKTYPDNKKEK